MGILEVFKELDKINNESFLDKNDQVSSQQAFWYIYDNCQKSFTSDAEVDKMLKALKIAWNSDEYIDGYVLYEIIGSLLDYYDHIRFHNEYIKAGIDLDDYSEVGYSRRAYYCALLAQNRLRKEGLFEGTIVLEYKRIIKDLELTDSDRARLLN